MPSRFLKSPDTDTGTDTASVRVIQQDCIQGMQGMARQSVDMVFADPPYNLQLQNSLHRPDNSHVQGVDEEWDKFASFQDYDNFTQEWLSQVRRILRPHGTLWVIGSYHNIYRLGAILQDMGFWILNDVVWVKSNPMPNFRGRRLTNAHETLLWCSLSEKAPYRFNYQSLKCHNDDVQLRSDWNFPICGGQERLRDFQGNRCHPTQKPLALLRRIMLISTQVHDLVVDPFCGSGTTAVAAKEFRRRFVGFEKDADYCRLTERRISDTVQRDSQALETVPEPRQKPRIPFGALVSGGMIKPGQKLRSRCRKHQATVQVDGSLRMGNQQGSIHRLGAWASGKVSCNGWSYWNLPKDNMPIDQLRQKIWAKEKSIPADSPK